MPEFRGLRRVRDITLPAVLGRVCPKPCGKGCRRRAADGPVAVCELKRYVADRDLASPDPSLPPCKPEREKRVAVIGAGPTGLAAAYGLRQGGHQVTLLDQRAEPGGGCGPSSTPSKPSNEVGWHPRAEGSEWTK